jgi:hypothetical protein
MVAVKALNVEDHCTTKILLICCEIYCGKQSAGIPKVFPAESAI